MMLPAFLTMSSQALLKGAAKRLARMIPVSRGNSTGGRPAGKRPKKQDLSKAELTTNTYVSHTIVTYALNANSTRTCTADVLQLEEGCPWKIRGANE